MKMRKEPALVTKGIDVSVIAQKVSRELSKEMSQHKQNYVEFRKFRVTASTVLEIRCLIPNTRSVAELVEFLDDVRESDVVCCCFGRASSFGFLAHEKLLLRLGGVGALIVRWKAHGLEEEYSESGSSPSSISIC